ncbi:hypothetical protein ACJX0J_030150 [Zea mays]
MIIAVATSGGDISMARGNNHVQQGLNYYLDLIDDTSFTSLLQYDLNSNMSFVGIVFILGFSPHFHLQNLQPSSSSSTRGQAEISLSGLAFFMYYLDIIIIHKDCVKVHKVQHKHTIIQDLCK